MRSVLMRWLEMRTALRGGVAALLVGCMVVLFAPAAPAQPLYTVNGEPVTQELHQMMAFMGMQPGAYYVDNVGDFGLIGQRPFANIKGGPALGTGTARPMNASQTRPTSQAPMPQVNDGGQGGSGGQSIVGSRVFWVYSPSVFSSARGGSSGYIHFCRNGVFHRSSEGSVSVGGEYNSRTQSNDAWAGAAGTSRNSGRWQVQQGTVILTNPDGSEQRFNLQGFTQGRWTIGRTKYAVERGKASC